MRRRCGATASVCGCSPAGSETESDLDAYVERARRIDPDLWVVEIDDGQGRHFLTEPVEGGR